MNRLGFFTGTPLGGSDSGLLTGFREDSAATLLDPSFSTTVSQTGMTLSAVGGETTLVLSTLIGLTVNLLVAVKEEGLHLVSDEGESSLDDLEGLTENRPKEVTFGRDSSSIEDSE